jgi:hypothetical protein
LGLWRLYGNKGIPTEVVLTPNSTYMIKINNMAGRDLQAMYESRFYEIHPRSA